MGNIDTILLIKTKNKDMFISQIYVNNIIIHATILYFFL